MNKTIVKYIIIFVVFILGISIVSEWICKSVSGKHVKFQDEFEMFLENLKQEMKREYLARVSHYLESVRGVEHFTPTQAVSSPPVYINDSITPNESMLMEKLNNKIDFLDLHSSGRKTLGQVYNQIDNDTITYNNLNQHFKTVPYSLKYNESKFNFPHKQNYKIDYTQTYTPSVKPEYPYNIPGSSGIAPQETSYIYDEKYKNYKISPVDPYSNGYQILN